MHVQDQGDSQSESEHGGEDGEELRKDRRAMDDEAEGARVGKPKGAAAICYFKKERMYLRI